ncbi:MAG: amino acid permease [Planctomycetes bacterium]|nr:amino acid permease [Planctomycetota bacterium]
MTSGQLQRRLGLVSAVSITVGAVIGSGIFLKPLIVAKSLPSEGWVYLLWVGLGLVCLFGAFAYAELGAAFPEAGGQYAFLREGWGRAVGFLYGWALFWVINPGTVAALAIAFADNLLPLFGVDLAAERAEPRLRVLVGAGMILLLAAVNHFGVWFGALLQNVSTFAKLAAIGAIVVGGLFVTGGQPAPGAAAAAPDAVQTLTLGGLAVAFTGIFWAYEGWYQMPFNAAELRRPERDLARGLILGMLILIVAYTAINAVYLRVVPFPEMRGLTDRADVPGLTIARIFTPAATHYLTLLIAISVMGAANPNLLSSPRAFYAMAQDRLVPRALIAVHPRWGTPTASIWVQAIWATLIVVVPAVTPATWGLRDFDDVTVFVVFASFLFYGLAVAAVYRLRLQRPDLVRPYRCTGYPVTPALFVAVAVAFVVALLWDPAERQNALIGLVILASGVPYYRWWTRRRAAAGG